MLTSLATLKQSKNGNGRFAELSQLIDLVKQARNWYQTNTRWSIAIKSDDRLYEVAHRWFIEGAQSPRPPKALSARYTRNGSSGEGKYLDSSDSEPDPVVDIELYYNETHERTVYVEGHRVRVKLTKPEVETATAKTYDSRPSPDTLYFYAYSRDGQTAVVDMLRRLAQVQTQRKPALHLLSRWGDWQRRDDLPTRSLESVVLAQGQMERLRTDLEQFLGAEKEYVRRGLPWHRGYLLYGPPGCGKTSVIRALASALGLHLWYAPLSDLEKDTSLLNLISSVGPRSVLLLEDVDVLHAVRERNDDQVAAVTMAGLLNALDGVATPHGLITFLTTNNRDVIDPALLRPGRVDIQELIDLPTNEQLTRLWSQFYGCDSKELDKNSNLAELARFKGSTADALEFFKQHSDDSTKGMQALLRSWRDS